MNALKVILASTLIILIAMYIIGLAVPDDRTTGSYSSFSECLAEVQTPGMKLGAESNAPAHNYCRNWRDR